MLVVFGGLPGVGKTTIAREVARRCRAVYLRIDAIEQAIRDGTGRSADVGPAGYMVAYAIAAGNLACGMSVIADCVNPVSVTRAAWRSTAREAAAGLIEVEVICSDVDEHRRRVESRVVDIPALVAPTWEAVTQRDYEPWTGTRLVLDTATAGAGEAAGVVCAEIGRVLRTPSG